MRAPGSGAPHVRYDKGSIIMMDALVSPTHIALEQFRIDSGSDFVWEALGRRFLNPKQKACYRCRADAVLSL
jgi:hypothetical protein